LSSPRSLQRVDYGRSKKENLAIAPQYAPLASCAAPTAYAECPIAAN
jgi:hypothetical protein